MNRDVAQTRRQLREAMPVAGQWAYFDHAAVAPVTAPAAVAMRRWVEESAAEGDTMWPQWARQLKEMRQSAASLINATPEEIALVPNTTAGINLVSEGLDWRTGDNVVTLADEYPSNLYPWMHLADRGVETRRVPTNNGVVDYDQLAEHCDGRTRLITVSWVAFSSGCRRDLEVIAQIAARHDALLFVDAIQGLGAFPLDVSRTPIDFLAADGHKWLLGPEGAGVAYIRRDRLPLLRATGVGAHSVVHAYDYTHIDLKLKSDASRYEGGSVNVPGMLGLGASLELLQSLGVANVAAAILEVSDLICCELQRLGLQVISPRDGEQRSGIVSFELTSGSPDQFRRHCLDRKIALTCRAGRIRVSPHAYNDPSDVARLIEAVETFPAS